MNKLKFITLVLLSVIVLSGCGRQKDLKQEIQPTPTTKLLGKTKGVKIETKPVNLILNFGEGKITSYVDIETTETNVLGILQQITKEKNINLVIKKYSFGDLVEQIGEFKNSKDKAWIYYLNDKSGDVGADKKIIKSGDTIEWKYIKPNF